MHFCVKHNVVNQFHRFEDTTLDRPAPGPATLAACLWTVEAGTVCTRLLPTTLSGQVGTGGSGATEDVGTRLAVWATLDAWGTTLTPGGRAPIVLDDTIPPPQSPPLAPALALTLEEETLLPTLASRNRTAGLRLRLV